MQSLKKIEHAMAVPPSSSTSASQSSIFSASSSSSSTSKNPESMERMPNQIVVERKFVEGKKEVRVLPAIVHETIVPIFREEVQPVIYRERVVTERRFVTSTSQEQRVLPAEIIRQEPLQQNPSTSESQSAVIASPLANTGC